MNDKIKCATFNKALQDAIPPEIRAKMNKDRIKAEIAARDYFVEVCGKCFQASCWHGEFLCGESQYAGTAVKKASELLLENRESPENYSIEKIMEVVGRVAYDDFPDDSSAKDSLGKDKSEWRHEAIDAQRLK